MRKRRGLFGSSDSEDEQDEFIVCQNGSLNAAFKISINCHEEEVEMIKWRILKKLNLLDGLAGSSVNNLHPMMLKIRLFSLKGGIEIMNSDIMSNYQGEKYIFYSLGEDFDFSVRMDMIKIKRKLGQGGFGAVYLAYDELL